MLETVTGTILDVFPKIAMKFKAFHYIVLIGTALFLFLLGIPRATNVCTYDVLYI